MARGQWQQGGSAGIDTEELTATVDKVLATYTFGGSGSDEPQVGTLEIQSIVNFKIALYGSYALAGTWQNPVTGPYSGVMIRYAVGQYPSGVADGVLAYEGAANSFTVSGLVNSTRYCFRAWSYITTNYGRVYSDVYLEGEGTPKIVQGSLTFTASTAWTVPEDVGVIQVFCVGGGGGGALSYADYSGDNSTNWNGSGSGGGYTNTYTVTPIPGEVLAVNVGGGGGEYGGSGGRSSLTRNGTILAYADGGRGGGRGSSTIVWGAGGGSGGAADGGSGNYNGFYCSGGSNGGNGDGFYRNKNGDYVSGGQGQGRTTRAFGVSNGTMYAGGGGASSGSGGSGGGGSRGAGGSWATGGGGSVLGSWRNGPGAPGGSGIILIRWGY